MIKMVSVIKLRKGVVENMETFMCLNDDDSEFVVRAEDRFKEIAREGDGIDFHDDPEIDDPEYEQKLEDALDAGSYDYAGDREVIIVWPSEIHQYPED